MSFKTAFFSLFAVTLLLGVFANNANAQNGSSGSFPIWVWYVERDATHLGGSEWTSTYGPFNTLAEAEALKEELDQDRFQGTTGFSIARIYSAINPILLRPITYRRVIPLYSWFN